MSDLSQWKVEPARILWDEATVTVAVSDMRGIRNDVDFKVGGLSIELNPGTDAKDIFESGISNRVVFKV